MGELMKKKSFYQGLLRVSELIEPETNSKGIFSICERKSASLGFIFEFFMVIPSAVMSINF